MMLTFLLTFCAMFSVNVSLIPLNFYVSATHLKVIFIGNKIWLRTSELKCKAVLKSNGRFCVIGLASEMQGLSEIL